MRHCCDGFDKICLTAKIHDFVVIIWDKFLDGKTFKEEYAMYLISIYFDEISEKRISGYMKQIAKATGNAAMLDGNVPPHITIAAFQAESDSVARQIFIHGANNLNSGSLQWVSIGTFLPGVIYITPVLNKYLHELSVIYGKEIEGIQSVTADYRYKPYSWLPHTTLAKQLSTEQLSKAFWVMQNYFAPFEGRVTKIGLAKTNPYVDLEVIMLGKT